MVAAQFGVVGKAEHSAARPSPDCVIYGSGYGTTKGCGEWWPHAPLTVPQIAMVDGRKRPDLMMSALISNVPSTVGAVARAVQSMRDPRGVCRVRRRRTTRGAQPEDGKVKNETVANLSHL